MPPAMPVVTMDAMITRISGRSACQVSSTEVVYAPIIISAPCPSDTWPLIPVSTVRPAAEIAKIATSVTL